MTAPFAPTTGDQYLNTTLASQGETVPYFYAVTQGDLANEIGMISGQGPTQETGAGCSRYTPVRPGLFGGHQGRRIAHRRQLGALKGFTGGAAAGQRGQGEGQDGEGLGAERAHEGPQRRARRDGSETLDEMRTGAFI